MKPLVALLFAALLALCCTPLAAINVGDQAPDFVFDKTWNTDATRLSDVMAKGKLIILEQFATW